MAAPPTTSNTYAFSLSESDIMIESFERIRIRPQALTHDHFSSARRSLNLELAAWSNKGVNLWGVDLVTTPLASGVSSYAVPRETVSILDLYLSQTDNQGSVTDRLLMPVGRGDYAAFPNKAQPGTPSVFWFNRTNTPTLVLWPVPDVGTWLCKYYRMRRLQDVNATGGELADVPYLFLEAICAALAYRLSIKYPPPPNTAPFANLKGEAQQAWAEATAENTENVPVTIRPNIGGYWRV